MLSAIVFVFGLILNELLRVFLLFDDNNLDFTIFAHFHVFIIFNGNHDNLIHMSVIAFCKIQNWWKLSYPCMKPNLV